jgi:hypothetical protein
LEKATHYQRLAESRPWLAGFFCGIQFAEATTPEASELCGNLGDGVI